MQVQRMSVVQRADPLAGGACEHGCHLQSQTRPPCRQRPRARLGGLVPMRQICSSAGPSSAWPIKFCCLSFGFPAT